MTQDKDKDFMDFVEDAAKTTGSGSHPGWAKDFLDMLCTPDPKKEAIAKICGWLWENGYTGVRVKDVETIWQVAQEVGGNKPHWRKQIILADSQDY